MKSNVIRHRMAVYERVTYQNGFGREIPPDLEFVKIYFDQKGCGHLTEKFYNEQSRSGWKNARGGKVRNWKEAASEWIFYNR
ncbi:hypothetical protein BDE36_2404 [Arcticibacter tournemirensis]|uniref:Uncharacterized protein n=1 Tax=Arcticibacter tournemirensis TaxID=699437 RepID=A0A5M9GZC0_9SPHI|nr:hypothetical protein [Arcticibacter tournemirensis]KAA8480052.1 hypothetical protein F1649_15615 [Arcticibacter tournemirensis]TQM50654.1 hypothetical protein BDE36_2404 [Arcticibacter tournemirensis]